MQLEEARFRMGMGLQNCSGRRYVGESALSCSHVAEMQDLGVSALHFARTVCSLKCSHSLLYDHMKHISFLSFGAVICIDLQ